MTSERASDKAIDAGDAQQHVRTGSSDGNALAASEQRYRSLVDSVVDHAIFLLDGDGKVAS